MVICLRILFLIRALSFQKFMKRFSTMSGWHRAWKGTGTLLPNIAHCLVIFVPEIEVYGTQQMSSRQINSNSYAPIPDRKPFSLLQYVVVLQRDRHFFTKHIYVYTLIVYTVVHGTNHCLLHILYIIILLHGPLARYVKLRIAHAPGMPGTFSRYRGIVIPTCITARASRTCRDACRDR